MGKDAVSKMEDLMNVSRLNELLHKKEEEEKKKNCILWVLAIFGAVAAVAAIAYGVYRFFTPDYLEDFEDDFDDDFDDDFFEDEDEEMPVRKNRGKGRKVCGISRRVLKKGEAAAIACKPLFKYIRRHG